MGVGDAPRTRLRICTFKGMQTLPIYAARRQGYLAAQGLDVEIVYTTGSASQLAGLARGDYHLIQTAPDNVIHFDSDPADFGVASEAAPHITMVLGGSNGPLSVFASADVPGFERLWGATAGVDNPTSGFALVLRDLLSRNGLVWERDYAVSVAGPTNMRLDALLRGDIAATILYPPFDAAAVRAGCHRLAASPDYYAAYASLATAGTRSWIETHSDELIRYIRAVLQGLRWVYEPEHAAEVQTMMGEEPALHLDAASTGAAYAAFVAPQVGFGLHAALDDAGLAQVIALRARYGNSPRPPGLPTAYRDLRWYEMARAAGSD
jgi:ABC-type nitrate/sulfonate/bicarbonate transport system substrate-binding protein